MESLWTEGIKQGGFFLAFVVLLWAYQRLWEQHNALQSSIKEKEAEEAKAEKLRVEGERDEAIEQRTIVLKALTENTAEMARLNERCAARQNASRPGGQQR